jgi:O-antigen ligase
MNKLKKYLEYLIYFYILILPWQTILIFKENFIFDYKNQYATLGIYFSEIILWIIFFCFFIFYIYNLKQKVKINFKWNRERIFILSLFIFLIYIFSSIFWSIDKEIALNKSLYFLEAGLFFIILLSQIFDYRKFLKVIVLSSVFPCLLGIYSFLTQNFLVNKFLGLNKYTASISGASIITGDGIGRWLRAYGSFSHPNFFAGFLIITILANIFLFRFVKNKLVWFFIFCLQIMSLFFTFSRSAWLSFFFIIIFLFFCFKKEDKTFFNKNKLYISTSIILIIFLSIIYNPIIKNRFSNNSYAEIKSSSERVDLNNESLEIISANLFFGVGVGNYTMASYNLNQNKNLWEYQPVHNIFLLFLAETGLFGLILFLILLYNFKLYYFENNNVKNINLVLIFCLILPILLLDHYFYSFYSSFIWLILYFNIFLYLSSDNPLFFPKNQKID